MLNGWKTYLAAAGFLGLALYDVSIGNMGAAYTNAMLALGLFGLRHAISRHGV